MYRRLADAKLLRRSTDGGLVLYDVKSKALCPLLHVLSHCGFTPRLELIPSYAESPCVYAVLPPLFHGI